jgi:hypothetical protein
LASFRRSCRQRRPRPANEGHGGAL